MHLTAQPTEHMASSLKATVIIPKVATAKSFTWEKSDIEHLIDWMEENLEALRAFASVDLF